MAQGLQGFREAFTFDDVLLKPGHSDVMPSEVDIRSNVTRAIPLNIPIIASAMDTVTEARMAIAMAQAGGVGVIHRNFDPEAQAAQVRQVKKFESGMVVNPLTIGPDATLADALTLMKDNDPPHDGSVRFEPGQESDDLVELCEHQTRQPAEHRKESKRTDMRGEDAGQDERDSQQSRARQA